MGECIDSEATRIASAGKADCQLPPMLKCLELAQVQEWKYETYEFRGVCEIACDDMVVKCIFRTTDRAFYDVLGIDGAIRFFLCQPTSVERLCQSLAGYFPSLSVTVMGRADAHGWITSTLTRRHN